MKTNSMELTERQVRVLARDAVTVAAAALMGLDSTYITAHAAAKRILKLLTEYEG